MRTITEFYGRTLKAIEEKIPALTEEATKTATEALKAEGKSDEEVTAALPAAIKAAVDAKIGEENKAEGDKLAMLLAAVDVVKSARGNIKRVIVMAPNEGEKAPSSAREIDGKYYTIELFPEAPRADARGARDEGRGGRGGKRDGKGGRGGKGGGRDGRREGRGAGGEGRGPAGEGRSRGPRRDTPPGFIAVGEGAPSGTPGGNRPRRERKPRTPIEPYVGPNRIVPKGSAPVAPATGAAETASAPAVSPDGTN